MEDLALHVLDIAENSIEAGAGTIEIDLMEDPDADTLVIEIRDDGPGLSADRLARARDPFYTTRTTRKVGMGLSLLGEAARTAGGDFSVASKPGMGTRVRASFRYGHIDRAPLGDIETTLMVLLAGHEELDFHFRHSVGRRTFELHSRDVAGDTLPARLRKMREAIRRGEAELTTASDAQLPTCDV